MVPHMEPMTELAETVRAACLEAVREAWEDGGIQGLCCEGRWELAVAALQQLDVRSLLPPSR